MSCLLYHACVWKKYYSVYNYVKNGMTCSKEILLCVGLCKKIWYNTYLCTIMLALPCTTYNSKKTRCQGASATASTAAHSPLASVPVKCASSPLHGRPLARSVCFILRWGVCCVTFLSVHFKANFSLSGATSSAASATACGSLPPIPVWSACLPHHGQCLACSVCFISQWGLLGAPKCNPSRNR